MILKLRLLVLALITWSSCAKNSLVDTLMDIDGYIMTNISYNKLFQVQRTIDGSLLPSYLHVFNGQVGKFSNSSRPHIRESIREAYKSMNKFERHEKLNAKALKYFLYQQSFLTNEIESEYNLENPTLDDLIYGANKNKYHFNQYLRQRAVVDGDDLNYLATMKFWKDYHCLQYEEGNKQTDMLLNNIYMYYIANLTKNIDDDDRQRLQDALMLYEQDCDYNIDDMVLYTNIRLQYGNQNDDLLGILGFADKKPIKIDEKTATNEPISKIYHEYAALKKSQDMVGALKPIDEYIKHSNLTHDNQTHILNVKLNENKEVVSVKQDGVDIDISGEKVQNKTENNEDVVDINSTTAQIIHGNQNMDAVGAGNIDANNQNMGQADQNLNDGVGQQNAGFGFLGNMFNGFGGGMGNNNPINNNNPVNNAQAGQNIDAPYNFQWIRDYFRRGMDYMQNLWNQDVLPIIKGEFEEDEDLVEEIKILAEYSSEPSYDKMLAMWYLDGNKELGIETNLTLAKEYLANAGDKGDGDSLLALTILDINTNPTLAMKYLEKCEELEYPLCYSYLATMYFTGDDVAQNFTKSKYYIEKAFMHGETEPTMVLTLMYDLGLEIDDKEYERLMLIAESKTNSLDARLDLIDFYAEMAENSLDAEYANKYFNYMSKLDSPPQIAKWYEYGVRKYMIGDFDRALLAFSFCALNNEVNCMMAAAYIWEKNYTQELSCKIESCASYYYLQAHMRGNIKASAKLAHILRDSTNLFIEDVELVHPINKYLSYNIFNEIADKSVEAKYNVLQMDYYGIGVDRNQTEAHTKLDGMLSESFENGFKTKSNRRTSFKHLNLLCLTKLYYYGQEMVDFLTSYF